MKVVVEVDTLVVDSVVDTAAAVADIADVGSDSDVDSVTRRRGAWSRSRLAD